MFLQSRLRRFKLLFRERKTWGTSSAGFKDIQVIYVYITFPRNIS